MFPPALVPLALVSPALMFLGASGTAISSCPSPWRWVAILNQPPVLTCEETE